MESEQKELKQKIDWKRKGLGWIPDYPDLRDYKTDDKKIHEALRKSDVTEAVENLTEKLIKTLEFLKGEYSPLDSPNEFDTSINELSDQVFGNINFITVNFYKILRTINSSSRHQNLLYSSQQKSQLARQILELKSYLYVLASKLDLQCKDSEDYEGSLFLDLKTVNSQDSVVNFEKVDEIVKWLREEEFDETIRRLVMVFQVYFGIEVDGVVGLNFYHALSKNLPSFESIWKKRLEPLKNTLIKLKEKNWEANEAKIDKSPSQTPLSLFLEGEHGHISRKIELHSIPKVRLISVPSLIPSAILHLISEFLIARFAKRLSTCLREANSIQELIKALFKQEETLFMTEVIKFIEEKNEGKGIEFEIVGVDQFQRLFLNKFEDFPSILSKGLISSESLSENRIQGSLKDIWNYHLLTDSERKNTCDEEKREKRRVEKIIRILNNEASLIEPIISVIVETISPIGMRYKTLEQAVSDGLTQFEQLFHPESENGTQASPNSTRLRELATEAMSKVQQIIGENLQSVCSEIENLKKDRKELGHLDLASQKQLNKKWNDRVSKLKRNVENRCRESLELHNATLCFYFLVSQFIESLQKPSSDDSAIDKPNRFDKQELFELRNLRDLNTPFTSKPDKENVPALIHNLEESEKFDSNQSAFLPTDRLQIPVCKSLARIRDLQYLDDDTKAYLFLPGAVDLSCWCSPVRDQGSLLSCAAFAGVALIEYFANRGLGEYESFSPLFLYKATRNLMNVTAGDVGASIRATMKAIGLFGVPPEEYWQYEEKNVDQEPPTFCYSYAQNYQALKYFRLDYAGMSREILLFQIKAVLAAGFPCIFGFTFYTSAYEESAIETGAIPFPNVDKDKVAGGHAVVAIGYSDFKIIERADPTQGSSRGAIMIRSSWGTEWGQDGYGWLPYDYVLWGLTRDWWSLLKSEWFESDNFSVGIRNVGGGPVPGQVR